jgi:hypothetical protein
LKIPADDSDAHIAELQRIRTEFMTKDSLIESKGFAQKLLQDIKLRLDSFRTSDSKEIDIIERDIAAVAEQQDNDRESNPWVKNEEGNLVRFSELNCIDQSIQDMSREKMNR